MQLHKVQFGEVATGKRLQMCHFYCQEIAADKKRARPEFPRQYFRFSEVDDHLYESPADLEDVLFLHFCAYDSVEIEIEVVEDAVEAILIFDDLFDAGDFLGFGVIHE